MSEERRILERLVHPFAPDPQDGLSPTLARARRRQVRQRIVAIVVTLGIFGATAFSLWAAFRPAHGATPISSPSASVTSPSPTPSQPRLGDTDIPPGFVTQVLLFSSRTRLLYEAPPGRFRFAFDVIGCSVEVNAIGLPGGAGTGGCNGDQYLGWGSGSVGLNGALLTVPSGRTLPIRGTRVRVTLANGESRTVEAIDGLWMVVIQRCGDYLGTEVRTIEAISATGRVLERVNIPPESPIPGRPWPLC